MRQYATLHNYDSIRNLKEMWDLRPYGAPERTCPLRGSVRPCSLSDESVNSFVGDPLPIRILDHFFHFPDHCRIRHDFRKFISISHAVTSRCSQNLTKWLTPTREWIHYRSDPVDSRIRINPEIRIRIPDHLWLRFRWIGVNWRRYAVSERILFVSVFLQRRVNLIGSSVCGNDHLHIRSKI